MIFPAWVVQPTFVSRLKRPLRSFRLLKLEIEETLWGFIINLQSFAGDLGWDTQRLSSKHSNIRNGLATSDGGMRLLDTFARQLWARLIDVRENVAQLLVLLRYVRVTKSGGFEGSLRGCSAEIAKVMNKSEI